MAVVTISREFGSEGTFVAQKVAQALGYHFVDKKAIEAVLNQYGCVEFDDVYESRAGALARFDVRRGEIVGMFNRVILALARHGDMVILGRGSFAVLGGLGDVLNVRIQAPLPIRVRRVMERQNISEPAKAEALVSEHDKARAAFVEFSYGVRWDTVRAFDLVIDTGKVSPDLAVTWLVQALNALKKEPAGARLTGAIEVDPILASVVSQALECQAAH